MRINVGTKKAPVWVNVRAGRYARGWALEMGDRQGIDAGSINKHKAGVYPTAALGERAVRVVVLEVFK